MECTIRRLRKLFSNKTFDIFFTVFTQCYSNTGSRFPRSSRCILPVWSEEKITDARSKFELRRLKVPELKHFLKGKRIPYTEKRTEEFVLLDERTES